jgi:inorganic pyrophosphatase
MIKVLLEARAGSREKNRYDEHTLEFKQTRTISDPYPYPYGFILGTTAQDGDAVDCYLITKEEFDPGAIVDCEPFGLLEQFEVDEIDHKVLAALPGEHVEITAELHRELKEFICGIFSNDPEFPIRVGSIRSKEEAERHIREHTSVTENRSGSG